MCHVLPASIYLNYHHHGSRLYYAFVFCLLRPWSHRLVQHPDLGCPSRLVWPSRAVSGWAHFFDFFSRFPVAGSGLHWIIGSRRLRPAGEHLARLAHPASHPGSSNSARRPARRQLPGASPQATDCSGAIRYGGVSGRDLENLNFDLRKSLTRLPSVNLNSPAVCPFLAATGRQLQPIRGPKIAPPGSEFSS